MATAQITGSPASFSLSSTWHCTGSPNSNGYYTHYSTPTVASKAVSFDISSIPSNANITTSYIYASWSSPAYGFGLRNINNIASPKDGNTNITISSSNLASGNLTVTFNFSSNTTPQMTTSTKTGRTTVSGVYLYVEYTLPYTACTAPTSISVSATNVAPGASVTLSWSGAGAGNNNAITGYHIYRATSSSGTYAHTYTVTTTATSGSTTVTAPTSNGSSYYFKVYTIGTVSGYNSGASSAVSLTCSFSAPKAPTTISVNNLSEIYLGEGGTATLTWSGASAGTNNPIVGYDIYVDGMLYSSQSSNVSSLSIPSYGGGQHTWTIITRGSYSNSGSSSGVIVYTYTAPNAPTSVTVSNQIPCVGETVTLSWHGAAGGSYNEITGYHIYRSSTADGAYTYLTAVETTDTSGSCSVVAPNEENKSYYFKIATLGARANGSLSSSYAMLITKIIYACIAPTICDIDNSLSHVSTIMSWNSGSGNTDNPMIGYEIQRGESADGKIWSDWETISIQTTTTLSIAPPETYGNYYRYHVKTRGQYLDSPWKDCTHTFRRDHKPIEAYTDISLNVGETKVKAIHMTEPQSNISMLLNFYGLDAQSMTNIIAGKTQLKDWTSHVEEIRNAIDFLTTYHNEWIDIPVNTPRAEVIQQLRDIINDVHKPAFVLGFGKAGAVVLPASSNASSSVLGAGMLGVMIIGDDNS